MQQLLSPQTVKDYWAIAKDASKILAETAAQRDAIGGLPDQEVEVRCASVLSLR